ncbi:MAG TPA: glycosyltransferase 87 family protein [Acidimicrobiales bacterium]|nr:glycosyltransferase 87 family protein [Acidimicrobiales bacterium]
MNPARVDRTWSWVALAVGALAFMWSLRAYIIVALDRVGAWELIDLEVYRDGASTFLHHSSALYDTGLGRFALPFIYPPFAAIAFIPLTHVDWDLARQLFTGVGLAAFVASIWWAWGMTGRRPSIERAGLTLGVAAFALWLEPVQQTLLFGQINFIVLALVVYDLHLRDDRPWKGVALGLAIGLKLTPALFAVYLFLTGRRRAALTAIGTFAATVLIGFVVAPSTARQYWGGDFLVGNKVGQSYVANQSLKGVLLRLFDEGTIADRLYVVVAIVVVVAGLWLAVRAHRAGDELLAVVVTALTMLLVSPVSWSHHWVWVVLVLVLLADRSLRRPLGWALPALVALVLLTWAWFGRVGDDGRSDPRLSVLPQGLIWRVPRRDGRELAWHGLQNLTGNLYAVLAVMGLLAVAWALRGRPADR